jgi:hypothetical protein
MDAIEEFELDLKKLDTLVGRMKQLGLTDATVGDFSATLAPPPATPMAHDITPTDPEELEAFREKMAYGSSY